MEANLFEWGVGAVFVAINAYRRYNTPVSNRASTTFENFITFYIFYLLSVLILYVFFGALFDSSPETLGAVFGLLSGSLDTTVPGSLAGLSAPMVSALFLTTLLPTLPWLSRYDAALLNYFWDRGHIPTHVHKMAATMRRAPFNFSPRQNVQLSGLCKSLGLECESLVLANQSGLDFRWARINLLINNIEDWKQDDSGRLRRYMETYARDYQRLVDELGYINTEFSALKLEALEAHVVTKIEKLLDKSIADLFRETTVFIARAVCLAELGASGRSSRISQLGFEGGSTRRDRLSSTQIIQALLAILLVFLAVSLVQDWLSARSSINFRNIGFMTFLMFFTYGAALVLALNLKCEAEMGYNELTRERTWRAYFYVGLITAGSWYLVTLTYRYVLNMLSGMDRGENLTRVLNNIDWSYPYVLQSLALALAISWVLDFHQSRDISGRLTARQRLFDVAFVAIALGVASLLVYMWMEGKGLFEGYGTKDLEFRGRTSMAWMITKGVAVGAVVGWLVPMWFQLNRLRAPDQIAGRLIAMNKLGLSIEIRSLKPNQLIEAVAAVAATVAYIDRDLNRSERDVYQIICSHLAGLANSDVNIDTADQELDSCLALIENNQLDLDARLQPLRNLPLLSALMPFIASSIAFADRVYLREERELVEKFRSYAGSTTGVQSA